MRLSPFYIFLLIIIHSCQRGSDKTENINGHYNKIKKEGQAFDREYQQSNKDISNLYRQAAENPEIVIQKADSLLEVIKTSNSRVKTHLISKLEYLKAELYYNLENYHNSWEILLDKKRYPHGGYIMGEEALAIAANYTKLKQHDKAKAFVDSIRKGYYIYNYAIGNYYETVGDKDNALKTYYNIRKDKKVKHYAYYPLAVDRIKELEKSSPKLLQEMYYPTGDPSFEISYSDNENRSKIFDMVMSMPECKNYGVHIYQSPQTNDKDYYWIKVSNAGHNYNGENYDAVYDFFIYSKNFDIRYYDIKSGKLLSLEEWRRTITTK